MSGGAVRGGTGVAMTAKVASREGSLEASGRKLAKRREHRAGAHPWEQRQRQEVRAAQQQAGGRS